MPATLVRTDDQLELDLSTCRGGEFTDTLTKIKEVPGRRYEGDRKIWTAPADAQTAERIIRAIQPTYDPGIMEWVKSSRAQSDQDLVTKLPDDSDDLLLPWAKKRMPWQPEKINGEAVTGLKPHQRALVANLNTKSIIADDLGLGKTIQSLSYIAECLIRYRHDYEFHRVQQEIQGGERGEDQGQQPQECRKDAQQDSSVDRIQEANTLCGLQYVAAADLHGLGSRQGPDSLFYSSLASNPTYAGEVARTNGDRGAREVRRQVPELPSPAALARGAKLIVCPNSVKGVWKREIDRWLGEKSIIPSGSSPSARKREIQEGIENGSWIIINYEQLRIVKVKQKTKNGGTKTVKQMKEPLFEETAWLAVIVDEAHRAKNRKALQTQGLYRVHGAIELAMSGTPLMNSPDDLWSILHWLFPKEYTSYWRFFETYVDYVEGYFKKDIKGVKNPDALRFELNGRMYRRTKAQVLDLPAKQRIIVPVELDAKSEKLYTEAETRLWIEVETAVQEGDAEAEKFAAAAAQNILYQIPNGAARTVRLRQILSSAALLGGDDHSNKMDALVENVIDNKHKQHVVFSEFVESCDILAERLRKEGLTVETYTGQTPEKDRARVEDEFQAGDIDVLVGTIGAMREGLTLTAADTVHFLERSWVPAWNQQAEDRLHRIGQRDEVTVYIYEAIGTVDDGTVRLTNTLKSHIVKSVLPQDFVAESTKEA